MRNLPSRSLAVAVAALAVTTLGLSACSSSDAGTASAPAVTATMPAPDAPQRVDATTFAAAVATPGVVILDVRTPGEFASGHLDGAVNIDVEGADFAAGIASLDPAKTYAVYCRSGNRSQTAVAQMSQAGLTHIYELETGINGWTEAGFPTVS